MTGPATSANSRISSSAQSSCRQAPNFERLWRISIGRNKIAQAQPETLARAEFGHILKALKECGWVVGGPMGAARRLGLKRTTLIGKMRKMGILRSTEAVLSPLPQSLAPSNRLSMSCSTKPPKTIQTPHRLLARRTSASKRTGMAGTTGRTCGLSRDSEIFNRN
jgi:hypothetical protein